MKDKIDTSHTIVADKARSRRSKHVSRSPYAGVTVVACACMMMFSSCASDPYLIDDSSVLLNYQTTPSQESLENLSKAYIAAINKNRKVGVNQPGLYCDYAVTLMLLGRSAEADEWFNKEAATFPSTLPYVNQLRKDIAARLSGKEEVAVLAPDINDVHSMDEIVKMRPTEGRLPSELPEEAVKREQDSLLAAEQAAARASADKKAGLLSRLFKRKAQHDTVDIPQQPASQTEQSASITDTAEATPTRTKIKLWPFKKNAKADQPADSSATAQQPATEQEQLSTQPETEPTAIKQSKKTKKKEAKPKKEKQKKTKEKRSKKKAKTEVEPASVEQDAQAQQPASDKKKQKKKAPKRTKKQKNDFSDDEAID